MKSRSAKVGFGALLALALTVLPACGSGGSKPVAVVDGPWNDVVTAAEHDGKVNIYSAMPPYQNDSLVKAFNKMHPGIAVNLIRGAGELPARVESEIKSGVDGADVLIYSDPTFLTKLNDHLLKIDGPNIKGWNDKNWQDAAKEKVIIPTSFPVTMLLWNTKIFPDGFKTWDQLLDPAVKGKLALKNAFTTSMAATTDFQERSLGSDYLTRLGQQQPKYYASSIPMNQAVASGEVGVTNLSTPASVKELLDSGAPVGFAYPKPSLATPIASGALSTSKRPNAARVFVDFIMSPEGQTAINGDGFGAAGREGIKGSLDLAGSEVFDSAQYTPEKMKTIQARFEGYFGH